MKIINKTVKLKLVGINGNAYNVMGAFQREARRQGWKDWEIEKVLTICQSSDYNNLLTTILDHCEDPCGFYQDSDENDDES